MSAVCGLRVPDICILACSTCVHAGGMSQRCPGQAPVGPAPLPPRRKRVPVPVCPSPSHFLPSLLAANATGEPVAMTTLHPPSSHPSCDRLSAPPILAALGGGALFLAPPILPSPPHPSNPGSPAPLLCPPLHPFIRLSLQRGGGGYLSQQAAPPSPCPASPAPLLGREEARVARVPMAGG